MSFRRFGIVPRFVDPDDPENFRKAITPKTKAIYGETISNPRGNVLDIAAVAKIAAEANLPFIIDNTFASPYLCRPIEHGANIVLHSLTKFIGGHGTSIGGIIVDGGKFDWSKSNHPLINRPSPAYHGLNFSETLGSHRIYYSCPRGRTARSGSLPEPLQFVPLPPRDRNLGHADGRHVTTRR